MLPTALVIGSQKTGTTWIHAYLADRGDVVLPDGVKETFFFDRHFDRGVDWYGGHFSGAGPVCVEVAPTYIDSVEAPHRILSTLGRIPLVCSLREPVQRTWSLYLHMRRYGMTRLSFDAALDACPELLDSGRYSERLAPWLDLFGASGVHVLLYEDLCTDPQAYADRLCRAVGVPLCAVGPRLREPVNTARLPRNALLAAGGQWIADTLRRAGAYGIVNVAKALGFKRLFFGGRPAAGLSMSPAARQRLQAYFAPERQRLEALLGRSLSAWAGEQQAGEGR